MVRGKLVSAILLRGTLLLLLWWILLGGGVGSLAFGLPLAALATWLSLTLLPPAVNGVRWLAFPGFVGYFLLEMFKGGADVARRALHPGLPIRPEFLRLPLRLERPASRIFLTWTAGLLPGTVSVYLLQDELEIHVLDRRSPNEQNMRYLESRIARLFGEGL